MKLNKKTLYTIEILIHLANNNEITNVSESAEKLNIPLSNFQKIITLLRKKDYVDSKRGVNGGVRLIADPKDIDFYEVFLETENINLDEFCDTDCANCTQLKYCRYGKTIQSRYATFVRSFEGVTLQDVIDGGF